MSLVSQNTKKKFRIYASEALYCGYDCIKPSMFLLIGGALFHSDL